MADLCHGGYPCTKPSECRRNLRCTPPAPAPEPYCDHGPFDACRCLAGDADLMAAAQRAYQEQREADATHDA